MISALAGTESSKPEFLYIAFIETTSALYPNSSASFSESPVCASFTS